MSIESEHSRLTKLIQTVAPSRFAIRHTKIAYPPLAHCHIPENKNPPDTLPLHTAHTPYSSYRPRGPRDWQTIVLGIPCILVFLAFAMGTGILICLLSLGMGHQLLRNHIPVTVTKSTWIDISAWGGTIFGIFHFGPIVAGIVMYPYVKSLRLWTLLIVLLWQPLLIVHAVVGVSFYREADKPSKEAVIAFASLGGFVTTSIFTMVFALFLQCHRMSRRGQAQ